MSASKAAMRKELNLLHMVHRERFEKESMSTIQISMDIEAEWKSTNFDVKRYNFIPLLFIQLLSFYK